MASQSHVSAPSTTNSQPAGPSSTPGITRESFLQRARAAALRDKGRSGSPTFSRAQYPTGSHDNAAAQKVTQPDDAKTHTGQSAHSGSGSAPAAPQDRSNPQGASSWTVEQSSHIAEHDQAAPASSSPTTVVMELNELQDLKADQRHSSPDSVEFIQETGPTHQQQQRRWPHLESSASAMAPSSSTSQPAPAVAPPSLHNFAQDPPSAAIDAQLEPETTVAEPEASGAATSTVDTSSSLPAAESSGLSSSQPALFGEPSPLLPLIQSFPPDCRRIAIRSFETPPEDIRRKVLGSTAMTDNFKAYVLTNVVPAQQQQQVAATTATTTSQPPATITPQSTFNQLPDVLQQSQAQQVQQVQLAQLAEQQAQATAAPHISNIGKHAQPSTNSGNLPPAVAPSVQHPSTFAATQQQSPVIQQATSPVAAFRQSPGVSHTSTLQSPSPVIVQAAAQHYGPAVLPSAQQVHQAGLLATAAPAATSAVSSALVSMGGMENRLGAWTQGLYQDVRQNLVAPMEAALREAERQRDQWKSVAENNSAALSQLLGQQADQQWQSRFTAAANELHKVRDEKEKLNQLYQASVRGYGAQTNQLQIAKAAYEELERKFNENRKHTLTIMNGFETLKRQNDDLVRQKQAWVQSNAAAQTQSDGAAQAQVMALQQQIQQLQQDRNAFASQSSSKDAKVEELEKRVKELQHDRETAIKVMKTEADKWKQTAEKFAAQEEQVRQADSRSATLEIKLRGVEMSSQAKIAELERRLKVGNGAEEAKIAELERRLQQSERMAQADRAHAESKAQAERRAQLKTIELEKQLKESVSEVQDYKQQFEALRSTAQAKIDQQHATIRKLRERNQRYKDIARQSVGGTASPALKRAADNQAAPSQSQSQSQRPRQE